MGCLISPEWDYFYYTSAYLSRYSTLAVCGERGGIEIYTFFTPSLITLEDLSPKKMKYYRNYVEGIVTHDTMLHKFYKCNG